MKKRLFKLLPLTLLPAIAFGGFALGLIDGPNQDVTYASDYPKSILPSTIYLDDSSESDIRSYYSDLDGKNLNGNDLLKALKPILSNGQKYHSYDVSGGADIWKMYEITDRDWDLSPADKTTTGHYDAETNTITNYQYGTGSSNVGSNPYVHTLYHNRGEADGNVKAWDLHGKDGGTDREHIWPKSRGFDDDATGKYGARGDIMHLWSGDHSVNSYLHNNLSYGFVNPDHISKDGASYASYLEGNYVGTSATLGSGNVFEPQDSDKGDIARACFYMVARYNNLAGNDDTIDSGNPNLFLSSDTNTDTITSTASTPVSIGIIQDLVAWHELDPVDNYEIHRNNLAYRNYTNNRNPFIDFPDWVEAIWGKATYDSSSHKVTAYDNTPSGKASPSTDSINGKTLVSLALSGSLNKISYKADETFDPTGLTITATYDDASTANVTTSVKWPSLEVGMTSIKGTYTQGSVSLQVEVNGITVTEPLALTSLSVKGVPSKVDYTAGDTFDPTGLTVTAGYNDGTTEEVTSKVIWGELSEGSHSVTGTYTYKDVSKTVTVSGLTITKGSNNFLVIGIVMIIVVLVLIVVIFVIYSTRGKRSAKKAAKIIAKTVAGKSTSKSTSSSGKKRATSSKKSSTTKKK
ncbi:MAG: endonuclease [Bacilli bacterium]|nr:endonuclease [Bacilli bacterium]